MQKGAVMYKKIVIFSFYLVFGVVACMAKKSEVPTKTGVLSESAALSPSCSLVLAVSGMT
jgi:hypothetical protein